MKNKTKNKIKIRAVDHFVTRAPFLPTATWRDYRAPTQQSRAEIEEGASIWQLRARSAAQLFAEKNVNEAIFLASRSLYQRLSSTDWNMGNPANVKLLLAFERYVNRMCFRSTPFGRFATVASGTVIETGQSDDSSFSRFGATANGVRWARVDFSYLLRLWEDVVKRYPAMIRYGTNSSITAINGKLNYIDWTELGKGEKVYHLSEVDDNPVIRLVLGLCSQGAVSPAEIVRELCGKSSELSDEDLLELVNDLIEANLLLPALHVDPLDLEVERTLCDFLKSNPETASVGLALSRIVDELTALAKADPAGISARYKQIESALSELLPNYSGNLIRVDTVSSERDVQLSRSFCEGLSSDLELLISKFGTQDVALAGFRKQFVEKHGNGAVPFMELLKDELLFEDMRSPSYPALLSRLAIYKKPRPDQNSRLSRYEKFLTSKLVSREAGGQNVLEITAEELEALPSQAGTYPREIFAIVTALRDEPDYKDNLIRLTGISNADIGTWQGRFCYALDSSNDALRRSAAKLQDTDAAVIHAEISYLPSVDFVNILNRPNFWKYRINLIDPGLADSEYQIPLSDIYVAVRHNEVQIFSKRLGKRIIPHMTTAHNVDHPSNMAAYIFLRHLGTQGKLYSSFNWSGVFKSFDYLPRIQYKNIILSSERWVLKFSAYAKFAGEKKPGNGGSFQQYLLNLGLPHLVEIKDGDNTLVLDTRDEIDAEQIFRILKVKRRLIVQEVADRDGKHSCDGDINRHEILLPLEIATREAKAPETDQDEPGSTNGVSIGVRDNSRVPLSEAIYAKVYLSEADADEFLLDFQKNFIKDAQKSSQLKQWFFVRYVDPAHHLRLRFFPTHAELFGDLLVDVVRRLELYQRRGLVAKIELCNYEREVVRYGGAEWMGVSEQLFHVDSELALTMISAAPQVERWKLAVWAAHSFLCDLGYTASQKHRCVFDISTRFKLEFAVSSEHVTLLGKQFRSCAEEMTAIVAADSGQPAHWIRRISIATEQLRVERRKLLTHLELGRAAMDHSAFDSVIASHIHMLCNRLLPSQPRAFEVLVYDTLERLVRPAALRTPDGQASGISL
jgi:thiopeptide-type bacteriocin biosynthesis protein